MNKKRSPKPQKQLSDPLALTVEQNSAIKVMSTQLLEMGNKINASNWTREHAVEILEIIAEGIGPLVDTEIPNKEVDTRLFEKHVTMEMLENLADALRDIKDGNVDSRFRPPAGLGGAAHKTSEKKAVKTYLGFVDWDKVNNQSSYPVAEKRVAATLEELSIKFRGKAITAKKLDGWRRTVSGIKRTSK